MVESNRARHQHRVAIRKASIDGGQQQASDRERDQDAFSERWAPERPDRR